MKWIYICLNFMIVFVNIHGKPYSIHVSIHYPKGNKRPEIYVSEGNKGEIVKDVEVMEQDDVPRQQPHPLHNPQNPQPIFPDGSEENSPPSEPQIVVPTDTEKYHLKKTLKRTHEEHQNRIDKTEDTSPVDLENNKQDDHRPNHHHRRHRRKHLKETYWNYKNLPPRRKHVQRIGGSSQTYDMEEVKAYERLGEKLPPRPDEIEYKEGAVEETDSPPHDSDPRLDYEDIPLPNGRGPAEKLDEEKETYDRADDFESYHPFKYKKEDPSSKVKTFDYKSFDPYHEMKKNIKQGYKDFSVVKGCVQVGHMMPNPEDRCGYLECVHAEEQHYSKELVAQQRKCAPGTAVPFSWRGGLDNPCTEAAAYCRNVHEVEDIEEEIHVSPNDKTTLHDESNQPEKELNAKIAN